MNRTTKNSELLQRIATYSAVAGASVLGSAPALADVVSINPAATGTFTGDNSCDGGNLDLDNDGNDDFYVSACDFGGGDAEVYFSFQWAPDGGANQMPVDNCSSTNYSPYGATNVTAGTSISETTGDMWNQYYAPVWQEEGEADGCNNFDQGVPGFVPFRLCNANGSGGCDGYRYGYLEVSWDRGSSIVTILGGEYETSANTPITAAARINGGAVAVPVGGAVPLGISLLALGAAALRRRRKHGDH